MEQGDRVRLVRWGPSDVIDDNLTVPPGTEGTIQHIDDHGTVHVKWDNGRHLGMVAGHDQYLWIDPETGDPWPAKTPKPPE